MLKNKMKYTIRDTSFIPRGKKTNMLKSKLCLFVILDLEKGTETIFLPSKNCSWAFINDKIRIIGLNILAAG